MVWIFAVRLYLTSGGCRTSVNSSTLTRQRLDYKWQQTGSIDASCHVTSLSWNLEGTRLLTAGHVIQMWFCPDLESASAAGKSTARSEDCGVVSKSSGVVFTIGADTPNTAPPALNGNYSVSLLEDESYEIKVFRNICSFPSFWMPTPLFSHHRKNYLPDDAQLENCCESKEKFKCADSASLILIAKKVASKIRVSVSSPSKINETQTEGTWKRPSLQHSWRTFRAWFSSPRLDTLGDQHSMEIFGTSKSPPPVQSAETLNQSNPANVREQHRLWKSYLPHLGHL